MDLEGAVHFLLSGTDTMAPELMILCKIIRGLDKYDSGALVSQVVLMCGRTKAIIACGMCDIFLVNSKPSFI